MRVGYIIRERSTARVLVRVGAPVGQGTNNKAEYLALISALRHALKLGFYRAVVHSDSRLVVGQMRDGWKVSPTLRRYHGEALLLAGLFEEFLLVAGPREDNEEADALSREDVFEEPTLPPLGMSKGKLKSLLDWQAAFVRVSHKRHHPGAGLLARIFGVSLTAIEHIIEGRNYQDATFEGHGEWMTEVNSEA